MRAADLTGLAPAVIVTAGFDPLLDQGEAYARRLNAAGVAVTYRCYDALAHAFTAFTGVVPAADGACREIADLTRAVFAGPTVMTMRALDGRAPGAGLRGLRGARRRRPDPAPGEVRVEVRAAAVNFPDLLMTRGEYQHKPALPFTPGLEMSRRGRRRSARASPLGGRRRGGRRIAQPGGFAEFVDRSGGDACAPNPPASPSPRPPAIGAAYLTAYVALVRRARAEAGEWVLVHGAAGGVGLACVDLARALGCRVIAASASDEKLKVVADEYAPGRGDQRHRRLSRGRSRRSPAGGADVIYDPVGGDVFDESVRCIAFDGRLLVVGFTSGRIPTFR